MNNVFSKVPSVWLAVMAILPTAACSDISESVKAPEAGKSTGVVFKIAGVPKNVASDATDRLGEVNVFHFSDENFLMRTNIKDPYAEGIMLPSDGTTLIYCVSGLNLPKCVTQREIATYTVEHGSSEVPMFYTATVDFNAENLHGGLIAIEMKRSVARIDFTNAENSGFKVSQVIVEDAPAGTFVFETDSVADFATVSYTHDFSEPFYGTEEGLFRIFESSKPVHMRIIGEYKDSPLNIRTTLPSVERNKAYTLQMVNANSTVEGAFTIKDWEEGASVSASPSASGYCSIDKVNSIIPDNVSVDYGRNILTVTHEGATGIKVAFVSPEKICITSLEGEVPTVKITPNEAVKIEEGYISSFNVYVQANNRLAYKVIANLRDGAGRADFFEIQVLDNPNRVFDTVEMAGRIWMAFNAMSADSAVQVFPTDGLTVEEMYQKNWPMAIGNFFQYGRQLGYSPWTQNDPNGNEETPRDCPWGTPEAMPVPPGYHVASKADWQSLIPNGVTIPATYTAGNGEEIKAELITLPGTINSSPSANANRAGLLMRYMRFESLKTGNVLIIPICGMKTPSWDEYPGGGRALHAWTGYWIYEDRQLWLFQVEGTAEEPIVTQTVSKWNYNGFLPVRGVKNLD